MKFSPSILEVKSPYFWFNTHILSKHTGRFDGEFTPDKWWLEGRRSGFLLGEKVTFEGRAVKLRGCIMGSPFVKPPYLFFLTKKRGLGVKKKCCPVFHVILVVTSDCLLGKRGVTSKVKPGTRFKPYMISTGFSSVERQGPKYRLDEVNHGMVSFC